MLNSASKILNLALFIHGLMLVKFLMSLRITRKKLSYLGKLNTFSSKENIYLISPFFYAWNSSNVKSKHNENIKIKFLFEVKKFHCKKN